MPARGLKQITTQVTRLDFHTEQHESAPASRGSEWPLHSPPMADFLSRGETSRHRYTLQLSYIHKFPTNLSATFTPLHLKIIPLKTHILKPRFFKDSKGSSGAATRARLRTVSLPG